MNYGNINNGISFNSLGDVAFTSALEGCGIDSTNGSAVFSSDGGTGILPAARAGEQAAGFTDGVAYQSFSSPELSDSGQLAFVGTVVGSGINSSNNLALFAADALGDFFVIAAEGESIVLSTDPLLSDVRTIASIAFGYTWNSSDELAFRANFADGTSALVVATIPAPASAALLGVAGLAATRRRR